jgi:hypothetical protein
MDNHQAVGSNSPSWSTWQSSTFLGTDTRLPGIVMNDRVILLPRDVCRKDATVCYGRFPRDFRPFPIEINGDPEVVQLAAILIGKVLKDSVTIVWLVRYATAG